MALAIGAVEHCLETLAATVRGDAELAAEFEASIEFFFRGPAPAHADRGIAETLAAARRHLEWFLMEYHSPSLRGSILDRLTESFLERVAELEAKEAPEVSEALTLAFDSLLRSHSGIFEVEEVRPGAGAWLRDLTGFGSFALGDAAMAEALQGGELIVGRLYPAGDGVHLASPAAAVLRAKSVTKALQKDLDVIRERGTAKIVRVSQGELEAMFFGAGQALRIGDVPEGSGRAASDDPVGDSLGILRKAGLDDARARAAIQRLAREPRNPAQLVHGASDALGAILEELAFDTDLDLNLARKALIEAWDILSFRGDAAPAAVQPKAPAFEAPSDEETARLAAIEAFEAGRLQGGDPSTLLSRLQEQLGIDDPDQGQEKDLPAPDFPGVVGAMIEEMKWELGATDPEADIDALEPLDLFAEFAKPIGVFEELRGRDMFQFATFWLQEKDALESDEVAVKLVEALRTFCNWALDAHEVDLGSEFLYALDGMASSLPRMRHANSRLDPSDVERGKTESGDLFEVLDLDGPQPESFETSSDRVRTSGGDVMTVIVPAPLRDALAPGDRLRGEIELSGLARIFRCYPPEAKALAAG